MKIRYVKLTDWDVTGMDSQAPPASWFVGQGWYQWQTYGPETPPGFAPVFPSVAYTPDGPITIAIDQPLPPIPSVWPEVFNFGRVAPWSNYGGYSQVMFIKSPDIAAYLTTNYGRAMSALINADDAASVAAELARGDISQGVHFYAKADGPGDTYKVSEVCSLKNLGAPCARVHPEDFARALAAIGAADDPVAKVFLTWLNAAQTAAYVFDKQYEASIDKENRSAMIALASLAMAAVAAPALIGTLTAGTASAGQMILSTAQLARTALNVSNAMPALSPDLTGHLSAVMQTAAAMPPPPGSEAKAAQFVQHVEAAKEAQSRRQAIIDALKKSLLSSHLDAAAIRHPDLAAHPAVVAHQTEKASNFIVLAALAVGALLIFGRGKA